jgi:hypothetical protein
MNKKIDKLDKIIIITSLVGILLLVGVVFMNFIGWWTIAPTMLVGLVYVEILYKIIKL